MFPVWGICMDGPCAGIVLELKPTDRELQIKTDNDGVCCYRRYGYCHPSKAKIALFRFQKSLVI
jgi:hypothetical protein